MADPKFVTKLDEKSQKVARDELNENPKDLDNSVAAFRTWAQQQKWLKSPTDYGFLLKYLRVRKHSQLAARETLVNFWTARTKFPPWFSDVDPADPVLQEILRTGVCYATTKTSKKNGRRVIFSREGAMSAEDIKKKYGVNTFYKATLMVCDWVNTDENVQVNGLEVFIDQTDITTGHSLALWNMENAKRVLSYYQNSLPGRTKYLYCYNEPPFFDAIYAVTSPFMREKTKSRFGFYGKNMHKVYEKIDMSMLPDEYLPDDYDGESAGPTKEIIENMIAEMMKPEFRNYIKDLSSGKYGVDLKLKAQDDTPAASFRKLNID